MLKFRTMVADAAKQLARLLDAVRLGFSYVDNWSMVGGLLIIAKLSANLQVKSPHKKDEMAYLASRLRNNSR